MQTRRVDLLKHSFLFLNAGLLSLPLFYSTPAYSVNLADEQIERIDASPEDMPAKGKSKHDKVWYERLSLTGFASGGYTAVDTEPTIGNGRFNARFVALDLDAEIWDSTSFKVQWQMIPLGFEDVQLAGSIKESYIQFKDFLKNLGPDALTVRAGKMVIPFGEEYNSFHTVLNPLLTTSVYFQYGWVDGVEAFGTVKGVNWLLAVMNPGSASFSENIQEKQLNVKISGKPTDSLYLSASYMSNARSKISGGILQSIGIPLGPVNGIPAAGSTARTQAFEFDAHYDVTERVHLKGAYGKTFIIENPNGADFNLSYVKAESLINIWSKLFAVARYSVISNGNSQAGFTIPGEPSPNSASYAGSAIGLSRKAFGLGYTFSPSLILKSEIAFDHFDQIDGFTSPSQDRWLSGVEVAIRF